MSGISGIDQFTLPLVSGKTYSFDINWGDGSAIENVTSDIYLLHTHSLVVLELMR